MAHKRVTDLTLKDLQAIVEDIQLWMYAEQDENDIFRWKVHKEVDGGGFVDFVADTLNTHGLAPGDEDAGYTVVPTDTRPHREEKSESVKIDGDFWVVIDPLASSEMGDVVFKTTLAGLSNMIKGGFEVGRNPALFTSEKDALTDARERFVSVANRLLREAVK